jgi:hypothetical protein
MFKEAAGLPIEGIASGGKRHEAPGRGGFPLQQED